MTGRGVVGGALALIVLSVLVDERVSSRLGSGLGLISKGVSAFIGADRAGLPRLGAAKPGVSTPGRQSTADRNQVATAGTTAGATTAGLLPGVRYV